MSEAKEKDGTGCRKCGAAGDDLGGAVKKGWPTQTLGGLCDILDSKRKPITKRNRTAGQYPYYGATGIVDYVNDFIFDDPLILVGEDGAKWESGENTAFRIAGKCWVNNHAHVLRPHRNLVRDSWLVHFLNHTDLTAFVSGLTVPKLNQGNLREISIPVPPLPEQQRIVGILDAAFAGIATAKANAEKNLKNARELFERELDSVFSQRGDGWKDRTLGEVAHFKNGLNYSKNSNGQTLPVVGVGDFQSNYIVPIENLQSSTIDGELKSGYAIRQNDILTVRSNGSKELVGRCMLVPGMSEVASYSGFIIRIRFDVDTIIPRFLLHFMKSSSTRAHLTREGGGANISNINQAKLASLPVPIPPFGEQEVIANTLDGLLAETRHLVSVCQRKLDALAELKKSLLDQAFKGRL